MYNLNLLIEEEPVEIGRFTTLKKAESAKAYMINEGGYGEEFSDMLQIQKCNLELDELVLDDEHIKF